ncbi:hypothetical protein T07_668 [Trichinella nelsoni]|uniref:Uncharacterized protein n=1 Tax=Trichinella nelsoni TaxID=6336 RepID=A0A0V0RS97_9BILA|nr:hypothetical protein T07_668 [Trichinella nelsoni]
MSRLTTDVVEDKGIFALGLSIAGVNADSDFSIHCGEMRLDPKVVIATDQMTDDTFTKFVSPSLPSHVVMENVGLVVMVISSSCILNRDGKKILKGTDFTMEKIASRPCNGARKERKGTDGQLLVSLPPDVADEDLKLQSLTRYDRTVDESLNITEIVCRIFVMTLLPRNFSPSLHRPWTEATISPVAILLRFSPSRIWIQADIKKMYLQIGRLPEDQELCRFVWQKAIPELLHRVAETLTALTDKVSSDIYVDHLKIGCDRNEETHTLVLQVSKFMKAVSPVEMNPLWKALGLYWDRLRDRHSGVYATRQRYIR